MRGSVEPIAVVVGKVVDVSRGAKFARPQVLPIGGLVVVVVGGVVVVAAAVAAVVAYVVIGSVGIIVVVVVIVVGGGDGVSGVTPPGDVWIVVVVNVG